MKLHDKDYFCNYVTSGTAKIILDTLQVRWSSPILFNDPFDAQFDVNYDFEIEDAIQPFLTELTRLLFSETEPNINFSHSLGDAIKRLRRFKHKMNKEDFSGLAAEALMEGANNVRPLIIQQNSEWHEYIKNSRVFCVAEDYDNLLMWAHYADCHKGIVIKFNCLQELDTFLCAAKPIIYSSDIPVLLTLDEFIMQNTGQSPQIYQDLFYRFAFTKSNHWSYEKEWRCFSQKENDNGEHYELVNIYPEEISAIYFGCKISPEDQSEIIANLGTSLSHVELFKAQTSNKCFELIFERIR